MQFLTIAIVPLMCAFGVVIYITMFRKARRLPLIALSVLFALNITVLSACTRQSVSLPSGAIEGPTDVTIPSFSPTQVPVTIDAPTTIPPIEERANAFIDPYIDEAIALIDADRRQLSRVTFDYEPKLLYDDLRPEDKALYDVICRHAQSLKPFSYTAVQHGYEVMDMVMVVCESVNIDHPDIENYFMLHEVMEGDTTTALEALYFMPWDAEQQPADLSALREEIRRFEAVCNRIVERMPDDISTYDKYRYLASVISLITSYDYEGIGGWQVRTAYGSIMSGYSVCQGYSRGFLYLCQKANLWCETVDGIAGENDAHAWNIVKLNSGTYFIDITWCDEAGLPGTPEWNNYFMLTQDEILVDHEITDGKVATGTAINERPTDYRR